MNSNQLLEFSNPSPNRVDGGDSGAKLQQWLPSMCPGTDKLEGWRLGAIEMMRVEEMMVFGSLKSEVCAPYAPGVSPGVVAPPGALRAGWNE
ncbi:hypothetical protein E3N88_25574 [Mikania micrantha]|uniref:Uncharacterized protein n=1 Tax=Mikania micrantha TaxID=192012 RepID=A0A5N6N6J8_9ASTR|nr:hypothetical protein E3N88_25574 [Mikania micrantha]